jgi:hypothetical protein
MTGVVCCSILCSPCSSYCTSAEKKKVEHLIASGLSLFGANTVFAVVSFVSVKASLHEASRMARQVNK